MGFLSSIQIRNLSLPVSLAFAITVQGLFVSDALAVGVYEAPCRSQSDSLLDAKKALNNCIDSLEQALDLKSDSPRCLNELKEVTDKAKLLRECRGKKR